MSIILLLERFAKTVHLIVNLAIPVTCAMTVTMDFISISFCQTDIYMPIVFRVQRKKAAKRAKFRVILSCPTCRLHDGYCLIGCEKKYGALFVIRPAQTGVLILGSVGCVTETIDCVRQLCQPNNVKVHITMYLCEIL